MGVAHRNSSKIGRIISPSAFSVKPPRMPGSQNIVGPMVSKLRNERGWTQAVLTARCARVGWDIHDSTIGKIEAGHRCVTDQEIVFLAEALEIDVRDLFPFPPKAARSAPTRSAK